MARSIDNLHADAEIRDKNAALGDKVKNWESQICDLELMSGVAVDVFEHTFDGAKTEKKDEFFLTDRTLERLQFTIFQMQRMIGAFRDEFYAAIEG